MRGADAECPPEDSHGYRVRAANINIINIIHTRRP